ncbi:hypothetical protein SLEP1_g26097 [Rubroshorea leprosula]|uniref:RNase H type-1 domain-containing protein n=1 Tax=Rubroshorea leprosula TaxID=152421 RepID=A0AAV5JSA2_9ROSI|nr:hypothetical protein SLEP1_g26097 [Rubroshorea leprosula]
MASKGNGYFPAVVVEAYSIRKALSWVVELGLRGVEVESDAACVVSAEGNSVVHELAKRALTNEDDEYWAEELSSNIMQCVAEDLRKLSLSV